MRQWLFDLAEEDLAEQTKRMSQAVRRERGTYMFAFSFMTSCYALIGMYAASVALIVCFGAFEYAYRKLDAECTKRKFEIRRIDVGLYVSYCFISSLLYASAGFLATSSNSTSIMLAGLIWMVGTLAFVSMNYSRLPLFYVVTVLPISICVMVYVMIVGASPQSTSTPFEWWVPICGVLVLLHCFNRTVRSQRNTELALEAARGQAADQMERLEFIASHDDLTGLLNRAAFNNRLDELLEKTAESGSEFGMLLLDLDEFKPINDCFGHRAGDVVLIEISARLLNTVRGRGHVARVGGDEFAVLLTKVTDADDLEDIARDLIRVVQLPVKCGQHELSVGISVGAAICDKKLASPEKIMMAADEALYRAKENNKSAVVLYSPSTPRKRVSIDERRSIEAAIKQRLIKPHYQPKFRMSDRKVIGFEALARWPIRPESPSESAGFISKIEDLGLLGEFTYHMARQVLADIAAMVDEGLDPGQVSINLSEATLATANGLEDLQWLLAENRRVVKHVTLEITEDVFIARSGAKIRENIETLREVGVRVSLDDFGTGFASFQHLRQLDFDELKIDTAFVAGLGHDRTAEVIVDGFLSIAQGLGVGVVAEGVETEAQLEYLRARGCPIGQGFLFSKAQPFETAKNFLITDENRSKSA